MPGIWITRIARRLTCSDTFERLVSPAIADLQAEAAHSWTRRWRHYGAFAVVLGYAVLRDFRCDVGMAFGGDDARRVWTRAAAWALFAGFCNWAVMYGLTLRMLDRLNGPIGLEAAVLNGIVYRSIVPGMVAALVVGAYQLKRREPSRLRTVVAASVVFILATPIVGSITEALHTPALNALEETYRLARPDLPAPMVHARWQAILSGMLQTASFAWLGTALARYRGWPLAFSATTIITLYIAANLYMAQLLMRLAPSLMPIFYGTYAIPANALTLVALIVAMKTIQRPFDRPETAVAR